MASGKFNRFLNFIGLVDDERPSRNDRPEGYGNTVNGSGRGGRPSTYIPPRNRDSQPRQTSMNSRQSLPSRGTVSSRRTTYGDEDTPRSRTQTAARRSTSQSRFDDTSPRRETETFRRGSSRFEEPLSRTEAPVPARRPAPRITSGGGTIVVSLMTLRDANKVIASLVQGYTIVMTLETSDPNMKQRIVDTLSGAVFALDATIKKASETTYLLAPGSVDVQASYDIDDSF